MEQENKSQRIDKLYEEAERLINEGLAVRPEKEGLGPEAKVAISTFFTHYIPAMGLGFKAYLIKYFTR